MQNKSIGKNSREIGRKGEQKAAEFLIQKGYAILKQNYRWARGEIDIVAQDGNTLIFVEVKTSAGTGKFGEPEIWVTPRKQQQIGRVASRYLQEYEITDTDCRFDVIGVTYHRNQWHLKHIENAFWL